MCRIEAAAAGNRSRNDGYAGDQVNTALYRFEKKNDKQLYLRRMVLNERADTSGVIFPAYRKSNVQGIVMAFDVRAYANEEYEIESQIGCNRILICCIFRLQQGGYCA